MFYQSRKATLALPNHFIPQLIKGHALTNYREGLGSERALLV
jgi:hypothetical protein